MNKIRKCDIIIPIYNAYECLEECIDSVIENTDLKDNGLIIINDKSTDKRVEKLLKKYKEKNHHIKVLENSENLGFVGTANRGMKLSKNDVLLLNSDTIVTPKWLEKIKECAYSNAMVATVTPLSNNATLASVPNIFERNELPKNLSLNDMSKIVEECSYEDYPEIPTAHGFCMFIRRSVLAEVGYFDEEAFGKGYGEENDFCFRCFDYGYRHLLCDNTYIYHKESQSFSDDKYQLMDSAEEILKKRCPQYFNDLSNWNSQKPVKYIGQNISFELGARDKKKNILFLIHDWKDVKHNVGGTTLHAYDLIKNLREKYNFHVLAPENGLYKLYSYWSEVESEITLPGVVDFNGKSLYNNEYSRMVKEIVKNLNIKIVHIHHMMGHYFDIIDILNEFSMKSIFSIHDLYALSPFLNRVNRRTTSHKQILAESCENNSDSYLGSNWEKTWKSLFKNVNFVVSPSTSAKEEVEKIYKNIDISVIEHGVDLKKKRTNLSIEGCKSIDIAFVGVIAKHKGSEIFEYLVRKQHLKNVKIHLFGVTDLPLKEYKYFINHGKYCREDLPQLLKENNIKLVCLFSLIPETYSYTLTESIAAGVPVIGTDIGAIGERIKRDNLGWLIKVDAENRDFANKIESILSDAENFKEVIKNLNQYRIRTTKEMSDDYENLYHQGNKDKFEGDYYKEELKVLIKDSSLYSSSRVSNKNPDYSWIFNTFKWKLFEKVKIPKGVKSLYSRIKKRQA